VMGVTPEAGQRWW